MIKFLPYPLKYCIYGFFTLATFIENSLFANPHVHQDKTEKAFTVTETEFLAATQNAQSLLAGNKALLSELGRIKHKSELQEIIIERLTQENLHLRRALYKAHQSYSSQPGSDSSQTKISSNAQLTSETSRTRFTSASASLTFSNNGFTLSDVSLSWDNPQFSALKENPPSLSLVPDKPEYNLLQSQSPPNMSAILMKPILPLTLELSPVLNNLSFAIVQPEQAEPMPRFISPLPKPSTLQNSTLMQVTPEAIAEQSKIPSVKTLEPEETSKIKPLPSLPLTIIQPEQVLENESPPLPFLSFAQALVKSTFIALSPATIEEFHVPADLEDLLELVPFPSKTPPTDGLEENGTTKDLIQLATEIDDQGPLIEASPAFEEVEAKKRPASDGNQPSLTPIRALGSGIVEISQFRNLLTDSHQVPITNNSETIAERETKTSIGAPSSFINNLQTDITSSRQPSEEINLSPIITETPLQLAPLLPLQTIFQQDVQAIKGQSILKSENEHLKTRISDLERELQETKVLLMERNDISRYPVEGESLEEEFVVNFRDLDAELSADYQKSLEQQITNLILERDILLGKMEVLNEQLQKVKTTNKEYKKFHKKVLSDSHNLTQEQETSSKEAKDKLVLQTPKQPKRLFVSSPVVSSPVVSSPVQDNRDEIVSLNEENQALREINQKFSKETSPSLNCQIKKLREKNAHYIAIIESRNDEIKGLSAKNKRYANELESLKKANELGSQKIKKLKGRFNNLIDDFKVIHEWIVWLNDRSLPQPPFPQTASREIEDRMLDILDKFRNVKHAQIREENDENKEK
ncbi:MAG: hypothetical protein IBJ00_01755 [Alphaproteobacteria bacterium]|nr:hypothetical protein [Alphaproteobacteria bacterium]